jgi:hypothetical protein
MAHWMALFDKTDDLGCVQYHEDIVSSVCVYVYVYVYV